MLQGMGAVWRSLAFWMQTGDDLSYGGNGWKDRNSLCNLLEKYWAEHMTKYAIGHM